MIFWDCLLANDQFGFFILLIGFLHLLSFCVRWLFKWGWRYKFVSLNETLQDAKFVSFLLFQLHPFVMLIHDAVRAFAKLLWKFANLLNEVVVQLNACALGFSHVFLEI